MEKLLSLSVDNANQKINPFTRVVLTENAKLMFDNLQTDRVKKIVGGKPLKSSLWPMIVSIRQQSLSETLKSMNIPYKSKSGHFCAGSLITSNWVITAASCFQDKEVLKLLNDGRFTLAKIRKLRWLMKTLVKRMNLNDYFICLNDDCSKWRSVKDIVIHPGYLISIGINRPGNDIALIKLDKSVNDYVPELLSMPTVVNLSLHCKTAGWGVSNINDFESTGEFREFDVKLLPSTYCAPLIKPLEICGVGNVEGNQRSDFCFFDTGGPLMCKEETPEENWKIYGIISRDLKSECGDPDQRGIYTSVAGYYKWIDSVIG